MISFAARYETVKNMENTELVIFGYVLIMAAIIALILFLLYKIRSLKADDSSVKGERSSVTGYGLQQFPAEGMKKRERILSDTEPEGDEYDNLISRLELLFEGEKLYLQPEVRITTVADMLHSSKTNLSKAIKMKTGKNFCQLVHSYRVREAMRLYAANQKLSISQLYKAVGFNSKTTFNTAFGRNTGCTPAEWCKNYRKSTELANTGNGRKKRQKGEAGTH